MILLIWEFSVKVETDEVIDDAPLQKNTSVIGTENSNDQNFQDQVEKQIYDYDQEISDKEIETIDGDEQDVTEPSRASSTAG